MHKQYLRPLERVSEMPLTGLENIYYASLKCNQRIALGEKTFFLVFFW